MLQPLILLAKINWMTHPRPFFRTLAPGLVSRNTTVVKRFHGGPRGPDKSVRYTTKSQAHICEDHAVVVYACNCGTHRSLG
jgi:hypothetical protein